MVEGDGIDTPEKYVAEIVLIPPDRSSRALLVGRRVRVTGVLFAHIAHHQRRILCDAKTVFLLDS